MTTSTAKQHEEFDELDAMLADMQDDVQPAKETAIADATADIDLDELSDDLEEAEKQGKTTQLSPPKVTKAKADDLDDIEDAEIVSETPIKPVKKAKASTSRFASDSNLVTFGQQLFSDESPLLLDVADAAKSSADATNDNLENLQEVKAIKAREKIANVLTWIASGKTLSKYTLATLQLVKEKNAVTKAEVTNHLLDQGVNLGTASSQSGQMTHILLSLKVATYESGKFVANPDSIILQLVEPTKSEA